MFKKVLIANRGEIALRVIRACKELGLQTVAVYSEADRECLHVRFADDDVCIGPAGPARLSYLRIPAIIAAAEITGADAIHPGYGFLAENAEFAEKVGASNIAFIGPTPDQIRQMGDKATARKIARQVKIPTVPGSPGPVESVEEALKIAGKIGFPVIIKAAAGGGGKGMRVAVDPDQFQQMFTLARQEALAAFGSDAVYLEKYLARPRHVEIQVMGDMHGRVMHLCERDCSVQYGMQSFDQSLFHWYSQGVISYESAIFYATNPSEFALKVSGVDSSGNRLGGADQAGAIELTP